MSEPTRALRFSDENGEVPRWWAEAFVHEYPEHFGQALRAYRSRVSAHHKELAESYPHVLKLAQPADVRVVCSVALIWVFARPSEVDRIELLEFWEHDELARSDIRSYWDRSPDHQETARRVAGLGEEFNMIDYIDPCTHVRRGRPALDDAGDTNGLMWASHEVSAARWVNALDSRYGNVIDRPALNAVRERMDEVAGIASVQTRGRELDRVVEEMLQAHGCRVKRGRAKEGEQIDVFVHRPFRALIECRWVKKPVGAPAIKDLVAKLDRRPVAVAGIYVSMSGFTSPAEDEALNHARDRTVVLFDADDLRSLLSGDVHVEELFNDRVDAIVFR